LQNFVGFGSQAQKPRVKLPDLHVSEDSYLHPPGFSSNTG
jgi:hypothetical protein